MRRPSIIILWSFIVTLVVWGAIIAASPQGSDALGPRMGHLGRDAGFPWLRARLKGPLEETDVRRMMEAWLAQERNPRLKLGAITTRDANIFQADIVTRDNSLVQRFDVDRHTGAIQAVED
jgi:hypothetical protein